ncbi:MAG: 5'-nucleotidase C-terminal domain-containing protein [Bacteroidales bacterium]|nr:5'-nucleotidase C-terminal domain-containing protein [Bacteroidales bacterium]
MKRKSSIVRLLCTILAVAVVSCQKIVPDGGQKEDSGIEPTQPGEYVLPLIETTDMHGYIVTTDNNGTVHYRLAYIADKADDIRGHGDQCQRDRLLLVDGGDLCQGASVSNLLSGWPVYVSMDIMGYDAVAAGNHEFDWGFDTLVDQDATLPDYEWDGQSVVNQVPVVCANLYQDGNRVPFTKDYVVVEKTAVNTEGATVPVKIGIIGFAVNYSGSIIATQFIDKGYSINDDYSIVNQIAAELESTGGCDATIMLIHGEAEGAAERLGKDTPVDLVLGGHSHRTLAGRTSWGTPYLQGGRYCEHYAYADLRFKVDASGTTSYDRVGSLANLAVNSDRDRHVYPEHNVADLSEEILEVSEAALTATAQQQNDVLGYISVSASSYYISGSGDRAAVISNWMCDILRRIGDADVAFVNGGGVRTSLPLNGQSRRDITVANVYEMFPFNNPTYVYSITYAELLQVLDYSMTSGGESLFSRMTGIDCYFTAEDHGTYTTYAVKSLAKDGTVIYQNGTWTGDWASRKLVLAVSEYLAITERTDYYTNLPNPLIEWNSTPRLLANDLVDNENAVRVLRAEASASGGHLYVDTAAHFILVQ